MRETDMQSTEQSELIPQPISTKAPKLSRWHTRALMMSPHERFPISSRRHSI